MRRSPRDDVCMCMVADVHMVRIPCEHVQTITLAWGSSRGIWKYVQMCQLMQPVVTCCSGSHRRVDFKSCSLPRGVPHPVDPQPSVR